MQGTGLPERRGRSLLLSCPVAGLLPLHTGVFHWKSHMVWGWPEKERTGGPTGNWDREKAGRLRKAAGTHLPGAGQAGGPGPGKSACLPCASRCRLPFSPWDSRTQPTRSSCGLRPADVPADLSPTPGRGEDVLSSCEEDSSPNLEMSLQVHTVQIRKKKHSGCA